eukprot:Skav201495  [mRNA]  locus=scaffold1154:15130:15882:+ [translate_table: standard]
MWRALVWRQTETRRDVGFDSALSKVGMGQDHGKKEWLVRFVGKQACRKMRKCLGKPPVLIGQANLSTCYLGAWDDADGRSQLDITNRLAAARTAWHAMQGWWRVPHVQLKHKVMVFRSLVLSSLLSGLEAATLTQGDIAQLERAQVKYLRSLSGRFGYQAVPETSGVEPEFATSAYKAKSNAFVRQAVGIYTIRTELLHRRLKWLQAIAASREKHKVLLAVVAGRLVATSENAFDAEGCLTTIAGPLARQ